MIHQGKLEKTRDAWLDLLTDLIGSRCGMGIGIFLESSLGNSDEHQSLRMTGIKWSVQEGLWHFGEKKGVMFLNLSTPNSEGVLSYSPVFC